MMTSFYKAQDARFTLLLGDCVELMRQFEFQFDMVFADPPYFLSNGGFSIQSGKKVCVNKGEWDQLPGYDSVNDFNFAWLKEVRNKLRPNGTIWISGTFHNIFSVVQALNMLEFKILNAVTWVKTNPPPNLACRCFTHSAEVIIWARKEKKVPHYFDYEGMRKINGGTQMKDVWLFPAIAPWEKSCGKHPTQKPLSVLARCILASTRQDAWILDPFAGSCTTGIASSLLGRKFLGIDREACFLDMGRRRREEIESPMVFANRRSRIHDFKDTTSLSDWLLCEAPVAYHAMDIPW